MFVTSVAITSVECAITLQRNEKSEMYSTFAGQTSLFM